MEVAHLRIFLHTERILRITTDLEAKLRSLKETGPFKWKCLAQEQRVRVKLYIEEMVRETRITRKERVMLCNQRQYVMYYFNKEGMETRSIAAIGRRLEQRCRVQGLSAPEHPYSKTSARL